MNSVCNNNLKQFLGMNKLFGDAMFMSPLKCNAISSYYGFWSILSWSITTFPFLFEHFDKPVKKVMTFGYCGNVIRIFEFTRLQMNFLLSDSQVKKFSSFLKMSKTYSLRPDKINFVSIISYIQNKVFQIFPP